MMAVPADRQQSRRITIPARGRRPTRNECGHPERRHRALGMCQACYSSHMRKAVRDRAAAVARRLAELERLAPKM